MLKLATFYQMVGMSQFLSFEGIEIRIVMDNIYGSWPRIRPMPKRAVFGHHQCARTGLNRLAGLIHTILADLCAFVISKIFLSRERRMLYNAASLYGLSDIP